MKCILMLIVCITFPFQIGKGNTPQIVDIDSSIVIRTQKETCFVVQLMSVFTEEGEHLKSFLVKKNKKTIANINLPSSEDVKNFSANIKKYRGGCILECFYGGGNNLYSRCFYFKCAKLYKPNSDNIIRKNIYVQPHIDISFFV